MKPGKVRALRGGDHSLAGAELAAGGPLLYDLMWLDRIPEHDIENAIYLLQPDTTTTTD